MSRTVHYASYCRVGALLLAGTLALPLSLQAAPAAGSKPKSGTKSAPPAKVAPAKNAAPPSKPQVKGGAATPDKKLSAADIADQEAIHRALDNFLNAWENEDLATFVSSWTAEAQKRTKNEEVARREFAAFDNIRITNRNIRIMTPRGSGSDRECMAQIVFDRSREEAATGLEYSIHFGWVLALKVEKKAWKIDTVYDAADFYTDALKDKTGAELAKTLGKLEPRILEMIGLNWIEKTNALRKDFEADPAAVLIEQADAAADALLKIEPQNRDLKGWVLSTRGLIAADKSRYEESIQFATRALEQFEAVADDEGRASALSNRANSLNNYGLYNEAIADFERSLQISRGVQLTKPAQRAVWRAKEATTLFNQAATLDALGRTAEALACYDEALTIWKEDHGAYWQTRALTQIGRVLEVAGRSDEALASFESALAVAKTLSDSRIQSQILPDDVLLSLILNDAIGDLHLARGRYVEAQKAYEEAMRLATSVKFQWRVGRLTTKLANLRHLAGGEEMRPELALNLGHTNYVGSVAISPDGKTWASGSWDGTIKLWDAASGKLLQTLLGHNERIFDIDFSYDGTTIASASDDSTVRLWTVATGALQRTLIGHDQGVMDLSFSPDGGLASCGRDGKILMWNPQTGSIRRLLQGHIGGARALSFSAEGSILASVGDDKIVRIWDAKTGAFLRGLKGHTQTICALAFSPDSRMLATGSDDETVRLWNPQSGALLKTLTLPARVHAVTFSADGHRVAIAYSGGDQVWDVGEGKMLYALQNLDDYNTWDIASAPDSTREGGEYFVGASTDKTLKMWDAGTGKLQRTLPPQSNYIYWLGFYSDNVTLASSLVSSGAARGLMLWDTTTGALRRLVLPPGATQGGLGVTRDGRKIIILDEKACEFRIHDAMTGKLLWTGKHDKTIIGTTYTSDFKIFASCSQDLTLKLWDMDTGKLLHTMRFTKLFADSDISPDGRRAVFYYGDGTIEVKEVASGKVVLKAGEPIVKNDLKAALQPKAVGFTYDGRRILTFSPLRLWDAQNGKLLQTFSSVAIANASFTVDGKLIASSNSDSTDNTVRVWDAETGKLKWTLTGHTGHVDKISFSPDGKRIATTGYDNTIKIWSTTTGKLLATMVPVPEEESGEIMRVAQNAATSVEGTMSWLTVTPDGYYTCSEGADYAINWRFGNRLVPFSDFEETFRRRDMVRQSLAEENVGNKPILTYARIAPALRFLSPSAQATVAGNSLHVEVEATDDAEVQEVQFFTNGSNVPEASAKVIQSASKAITFGDKAIPANHKISRTFSADLPLPPGEAEVLVRAVVFDKDRNSAQSTLSVKRGDTQTVRGDLRALCIGVSRYRNPKYNLQFAADDANALGAALSAQQGKNYANVEVTVLADDKASAQNIRAALDDLKKNAKPSDTVLIFLSGHGVPLDGEFYFAPHGIVADDIKGTALPWKDILDPLKDIVGKKIVLADACHSGARVAEEAATGEQILDASRRHKGIVVMASSSGDRYSYEIEELKHGAFTVALLEALGGKADNIKADGKLTLPELESYLSERTSVLTEGRQQPHLVAQDFNPQTALALTK